MQLAIAMGQPVKGHRLRPYQSACVDACEDTLARGQRALAVMPTGTGKTVVFSRLASNAVADGGRVLVLAHRTELLDQAAAKLRREGVDCAIEQADRRATGHAVVVGSVQTLRGPRLQRWASDTFARIIVDEAHHATAKSYRAIFDHFARAQVVGVTATADRGDSVGLHNVFDHVAYELSLGAAIEDGWLVSLHAQIVDVPDLDLSGLRVRAGDVSDESAAEAVEKALPALARPIADLTGKRRTIVFVPSVASAQRLASMLRSAGLTASYVSGKTPPEERHLTLQRFARGTVTHVVNCGVLTEGWDCPPAEVCVVARPTKSRALYSQMCGRVTRPLDGLVDGYERAADRRQSIAESAKPSCLILDFAGAGSKLKLVNPLDLLAGKDLPADVRALAEQHLRDCGDITGALELAVHEAAAVKRRADEAARRAAERAREQARREAMGKDFRYRLTQLNLIENSNLAWWDLDPFHGWDSAKPIGRPDGSIATYPGVLGQLVQRGRVPQEIAAQWSRQHGQFMATKLYHRYKQRLCTFGQARVLAKNGVNCAQLGIDKASDLMNVLAQCRWKRPDNWHEIVEKHGGQIL